MTRRPRLMPGHSYPVLLPYHRPRRALFTTKPIARTLDGGFTYLSEAAERLLATKRT